MSKAKKIISLLLSVIMIMSVFNIVPLGVSAAEADTAETGTESGTTGDCTWTLDNGVLTISGNGEMSNYSSYSPWSSYSFDTVVIEDGVKRIGYDAFYGCTGLTSIDIPDSVTSIGDYAFGGCPGLTSIDIPDSVTSIPSGAFSGCTGLKNIDIPDSVMNIGKKAFSGCTVLTSVDIPDSVTSIGGYAFDNTAWYDNQPDGLVYAGKVAYKMKGTCPSEVIIKDGIVSITAYAFYDCTGLTSVTIPDSVRYIGYSAFYGCTGLTSVTIPNSVRRIDDYAFYGCTGLTNVTILGSVSEIFGSVFSGCTGLTTVNIPDSVRRIDDYAFYNCRGLTSVTIPDSVTGIDDYAFYGCAGLTSVTIPDSVTRIYYHAFGYYYGEENWQNKIDGFTIYGKEGSEAERYASENGFTFIKLTEKKDEASGIITTVPDDVELRVINVLDQMPVGTIKAYDITLAKDSDTVQPDNVVTVKIPCANENAKVYRLEANSTMTDMHAKYADGYMVFTTDHFSVYVLAESEPEVVSVPGDVTGDGKTNAQDCTAILRYVRKIDTGLSDYQLKCGDVTGDGKTNVQDVTRILRHVRKIEALY